MAQRRSFDKDYLKQEFDKLNAIAERSLCAVLDRRRCYGVLWSESGNQRHRHNTPKQDLNSLQLALSAIGYKKPNLIVITRAYSEMQTSAILENQDGFRWDLFLTKVCGKLTLSAQMQNRATSLYQGSKLKVFIASKEDLFLFKGITARDADLDDTRILAQSGLNWQTMAQECKSQSRESGVCWEDALSQNLQDLKSKYGIEAPIEKTLRKTAEQKIIETTLLRQIEKGNVTVQSIAQEIKESPIFIRKELKRLANRGLIKINKSNRPHKFFLEKPIQIKHPQTTE